MAQLPGGLDDMVGAPHMSFGKQPAMRVEGQFAAQLDPSAADEITYFAGLAKAHRLELQHHDVGEAVVDLGKIDIGVPDAGHREGLGRREADPIVKGSRREGMSSAG